jgi:PKD repeat protein
MGNTYSTPNIPDQVYYTDSLFAEYQIILVATNDCGVDADTVPVVVVPINFKAFFNLDTDTYCQYETVQITNGATPGTTVSYNFGDGTTSDEPDPVHVYQQPGPYQIIQYARTVCGLDSVFQWVNVLPAPVFDFSYEPEVCQKQALSFASNNNPALTTCEWDFGDGNSMTSCQPSYIYQLPGTYMVTLTVTDIATGCSNTDSSSVLVRANPVAAFSTADTVGCGKVIAHLTNANDLPGYTHVWSFTPGVNGSVEANPAWLFDTAGWYSVSLLTTDDFGCFDDTIMLELVHVNPVPQAAFGLLISENCHLPATLQTQNQSTGALGYSWAFSNGVQSDFTDTTMVFDLPGEFSAILIALNEFQCADTTSRQFTIHPEIMADFEVLEDVQCARHLLKINNLSENTTLYTWIFSNGDTTTGEIPDYAFLEAGVYDIMLIAALDTFCSDTAFLAGAVEILPSPFAGFEVRDTVSFQLPDGTIVCQDTSTGATGWFYDFDDGKTSDDRNPLHRYFSNGEKT